MHASKTERFKREKDKSTAMLICLARTKSTIESTRVSMLPAYHMYAGFCRETSLHGMKHTVEPSVHCCERFLWLAVTLSAFGGAIYCGVVQWSRYNSEPVVMSMQRDYRQWWSAFPAITACFVDRLDPDIAKDVIQKTWNVTEQSDQDLYEYYSGFLDLVTDVSFRTNLQNFWKYQNDDSVKNIDLMSLALKLHPLSVLKVVASETGKDVYWIPVMTEVGMCMTFNSMYARYQHALPNVEPNEHQLYRCHYLSGQCYARVDSLGKPVRYFIHSPFEISTALSNPTGEVSPGEELVIDFKAVEIQAAEAVRKLRPDQRRCRYPDEWISSPIKAYSFGLCQMQCRNRMALMFCGCRPYFYAKGDGEPCDAHGMACIGRNVEILINLPRNLAKCSCLPQCTELNYYSHTKKVVDRRPLTINMNASGSGEEDGSISALRVNTMPPKFRLKRDVIFTLEDLFASFGGTTALFVGASALTAVETVLFIVRHLVRVFVLRQPMEDRVVMFNP